MTLIAASESEKKCAKCSGPASLTCSRCKGAIYCDLVCQKAAWAQHKKICNIVNLDQTVHRAGALLQKLLLLWREKALTDSIISIEDVGHRVYVFQQKSRPDAFYPFPKHLVKDEDTKKMVLTMSMCAEFIAYFPDIVREMLKGTSVKIEETTLQLKEPSRSVFMVTGAFKEDRPQSPHNIFQVTSTDRSRKWYLDATGAQINISTTCATVEEYLKQYGGRPTTIAPLGMAKNLYQELCDAPGLSGVQQTQRRCGVRAAEEGIEDWTAASGMTLPGLLRLPADRYATEEQKLLDIVTKSLQRFVIRWDRKAQVDILTKQSSEQHMRDHMTGMQMFAKYDHLVEPYKL